MTLEEYKAELRAQEAAARLNPEAVQYRHNPHWRWEQSIYRCGCWLARQVELSGVFTNRVFSDKGEVTCPVCLLHEKETQ